MSALRAFPLLDVQDQRAQEQDVRGENLPRTAKDVWRILCRYRDAENRAWPKVETIADELDLSARTVQRGLAHLVESGWLTTDSGRTGGLHRGTIYLLSPKPKTGEFRSSPTLVTGDSLAPERVTTKALTGDKYDGAIRKNLSTEPSNTRVRLLAPVMEAAIKIHKSHPAYRRDVGVNVIAKQLQAILRHKRIHRADTESYLTALVNRHRLTCESEQWRQDGGKYAKGLANWLAPTKERYEHEAVQAAALPSQPIAGLKAGEIE